MGHFTAQAGARGNAALAAQAQVAAGRRKAEVGWAVLPAGLNSQYCFESILFFPFLVNFFYFLDNGNWLK